MVRWSYHLSVEALDWAEVAWVKAWFNRLSRVASMSMIWTICFHNSRSPSASTPGVVSQSLLCSSPGYWNWCKVVGNHSQAGLIGFQRRQRYVEDGSQCRHRHPDPKVDQRFRLLNCRSRVYPLCDSAQMQLQPTKFMVRLILSTNATCFR